MRSNDVSDYDDQDMADLKAIMSGGKNYVARMTALLEAKEKADQLIADANEAAQATAAAALRDRTDAMGVLEDARREAAEIIAGAQAENKRLVGEGAAIVSAAKSQADGIVADARAEAEEMSERARAVMEELAHAKSALDQRSSDLDAVQSRLDEKSAELDAALESANAIKTKYEGVIARITAAISA